MDREICLMPDHLHAFVATDDQRITLAAWGKSLKNSISKVFRAKGIASPHWGEDIFRSFVAQQRIVFSEMGIHTQQSGTRWLGEEWRRLAVRRADFSSRIPQRLNLGGHR